MDNQVDLVVDIEVLNSFDKKDRKLFKRMIKEVLYSGYEYDSGGMKMAVNTLQVYGVLVPKTVIDRNKKINGIINE